MNKPKENHVYALTGGANEPSIMNGNSWEESEVPTVQCDWCGNRLLKSEAVEHPYFDLIDGEEV